MTHQPKLTVTLFFATPGTTWGGMEKHTADLARALASRGHSVHVIGHEHYRQHFPDSVHFHAAPVQLGRRNPWLHFSLKQRLRKIAPDILHAQGNKAAQLVGNIKQGAGCARVGTVHGSKSSHRAFRKLDTVIAVSPQIFDGLDHPNKHLIFNGISTPSESHPIKDQCRVLPAGVTNVVAIGRLEPVKGFATLIRAWAILSGEIPDAHLTIFGEGTLHSELERLVASLGLENRATLAGFCDDLAPVYRQADLVVISSEREGFPYVLIESLLAGCPIISTPVSGPAYMLPSQAISPDWEPNSLANMLQNALANLSSLKEAEAAAMAFARDELTLECMTVETERLYRNTLSAKATE
ncbi:glycosyltransferase [Marinobacter sp. F4206]|uniref:glycosyltransferase n=1 Tax=Marinobacter sp. F4206 TaxID=2861777 RepID=UPI001C5F0D8F|nr:glycosyltransferase [Marinobacter sp. F4206]MBW4936469.1 glycosyltransferase [Marinobacter sp. F4206]